MVFSAGDLKVCLSSFEFSFYYQNEGHAYCPNCGYYFSTEPSSEVRLSSILLLIGVGSYVCYRILKRRKRRDVGESSKDLDIIQSFIDGLYDSTSKISGQSSNRSCSSNVQHALSEKSDSFIFDSFDESPLILDVASPSGCQDITKSRSFSIASQSSLFGSSTISKLDQLLYQIEDIKKSVAEMDTDLVQVGSSTRKLNLQYLHLTESSMDESCEQISSLGVDPSPSLEWDSNDVIFSEDGETKTIGGFPSSSNFLAGETGMEKNTLQVSLSNIISSLPSSESSMYTSYTSDKDSLLSTPDQEHVKHRALLELVDEAKRLGLFNELMEVVVRHSKRDSAFCED